jgi:hypothetical protein
MEHIPAMHAAAVGMRYPARVLDFGAIGAALELDLSAVAPGRNPTLRALLVYDTCVNATAARVLRVGDRVEVVLIEVDRQFGYLTASLPADPALLAWNNGTVRHLAQRIRDTGETVLMPVLADALEEAGCADAAMLAHCRQPPGGRSWVVELLAAQE